MEYEVVRKLVTQFAEIVRQNFPVQRVVLFGSQVRGTSHPDSDIDVAVIYSSGSGLSGHECQTF